MTSYNTIMADLVVCVKQQGAHLAMRANKL